MNVIPYDFKKAVFQHFGICGYWVTLYFLFDGISTYTFRHQHDVLENAALCKETGLHPVVFTHKFLVTKSDFPDIFNEIESYVSNSNFD